MIVFGVADPQTHTRREVLLGNKFRVVIPPHSKIQGESGVKLPVVLEKQCVVIVAQTNLVRFRRQTPDCRLRKEPRVYRSKCHEVRNRGEELEIQNR